jgi:NAD(P)-dependent dehydrogenase (short-subunit alcohol dehydrogenase family)
LEYAKSGIRINAVAPGRVETDMLNQTIGEKHQFLIPIGRTGNPDEIANAVVWLLSDNASFVLGHTLLVDGGIVGR